MFLCFFLTPLFLHTSLKICLSLSSLTSPLTSTRQVSCFLPESHGQGEGDQFRFCWALCHTLATPHLIIALPRTLWKSHLSHFIISVQLFGKPFFFISSMKTCCYKAFLLTTEIPPLYLSLSLPSSFLILSFKGISLLVTVVLAFKGQLSKQKVPFHHFYTLDFFQIRSMWFTHIQPTNVELRLSDWTKRPKESFWLHSYRKKIISQLQLNYSSFFFWRPRRYHSHCCNEFT